MQRSLLVLSASALVSLACAQTPLLDGTARWDETGGYFSAPVSGSTTYSYHLEADTLIAGQTYYKVQRTGVDSVYMMVPFPPYTQFQGANSMDAYMGALREDAVQRKWYMVFNGQSTESLLYDFDLVVGSTISGTFGDCSSNPTVTYIDQVTVDGTTRNRYHLTFGYLIEGIGANTGLFGYLCQFFESGSCLEVFHQGADSLIVDGCSPLQTGIDEDDEPASISLFPNPASSTVTLVPVDATPYTITVLDALGRIALTGRAQGQCWTSQHFNPARTWCACARTDRCTTHKLHVALAVN